MIVIVDTTETFQDLRLSGPNWTLLGEFLRRDGATLVIPAMVIDETVNHYSERVTETIKKYRTAHDSLCRLLPGLQSNAMNVPDLETAVRNYRESLMAHLKKLQAKSPNYREVLIENLVARALARRKPFDANGQRGFRDAIIWENLLTVAASGEESIALITANASDFGDTGLHPSLIQDLALKGIPADRVTLYPGLGKFVEMRVKPTLEKLDAIKLTLNENTFPNFQMDQFFHEAYSEIEEAVSTYVKYWDFERVGFTYRRLLRSPVLSKLDSEYTEFAVDEVYRVGEGQLSLTARYEMTGAIECWEVCDNGPDWPPERREHRIDAIFEVSVLLVLEQGTGQVNEFSVDAVTINPT